MESDSEGGDRFYPFGENPSGALIYNPDGYMSANIVSRNRSLSNGRIEYVDGEGGQNEVFRNEYIGYSGCYTVEWFSKEGDPVRKGVIYHSVEVSFYPDWVGSVFKRPFSLEGHILIIAAPEPRVGPDGRSYRSRLVWRRKA
ncbi:lipocalin-like domain-containing protein [Microbulbifer halophilus]